MDFAQHLSGKRSGPWVAPLICLCLLVFSQELVAGTLRLGTPTVENNQYTFPVVLQGSAEEVAALDFRLAYDPAVFSPVGAQSGRNALQAQKQVSSNIAAPGEFVVVMMGFNQNSVAPGEVVEVVLQKIGEPTDGQTLLRISEPTLATHVGVEVDSRGLGRTVRFNQEKNDSDPRDDAPRNEDDDPNNASADPNARDQSMDDTSPADANAGNGPFFLAGIDDLDGTPSRQASTPSAAAPSSAAAAPPAEIRANSAPNGVGQGVQTDDSNGGNADPTATPSVTLEAKAARATGESEENSRVDTKAPQTDHTSEAVVKTTVTTNNNHTNKTDKNFSRHFDSKYARIMLLTVGVPLGLFLLLRASGK